MNDYVLKHDFGYGREEELPIKKLLLRNFEDCKDYVDDIVSHSFEAKVENSTLFFTKENLKVQVFVNLI